MLGIETLATLPDSCDRRDRASDALERGTAGNRGPQTGDPRLGRGARLDLPTAPPCEWPARSGSHLRPDDVRPLSGRFRIGASPALPDPDAGARPLLHRIHRRATRALPRVSKGPTSRVAATRAREPARLPLRVARQSNARPRGRGSPSLTPLAGKRRRLARWTMLRLREPLVTGEKVDEVLDGGVPCAERGNVPAALDRRQDRGRVVVRVIHARPGE